MAINNPLVHTPLLLEPTKDKGTKGRDNPATRRTAPDKSSSIQNNLYTFFHQASLVFQPNASNTDTGDGVRR